ncbi:hypothetical protein [Pseudomonas shirazensis]|uniref:hypothetical protein n=1 Tax=Pseudomonas shirazensis TaxID=2745494 RepID=UPI003D27FB63
MSPASNIIDFNLYRKRKQAQQIGRLMWALYAQQSGLAAQPHGNTHIASNAPRLA